MLTWKISRYWNRFAYRVMDLGRWMIWDRTGGNERLLQDDCVMGEYTRAIMTKT